MPATSAERRPFRFGVGSLLSATTRQEQVDHVQRAEDAGYDFATFSDHFFVPFSPMVAMALAAEVTTRLRLLPFMLANDLRNPAVLAKDVATLDVVSGGRVELGIGAGWSAADFTAAGLPFLPAGERIARLEQAIEVLRGAWRGEPFDHDGPAYPVRGLVGTPAPVQPGGPPLMVGGGGRKILTLAARVADIVTINPQPIGVAPTGDATPAERLAERVAWIDAATEGRATQPERHILIGSVAVTDDRRAGAERAIEFIASRPGVAVLPEPDELLASPFAAIGSVAHLCAQLEELRATTGISSFSVPADALTEFAPVVAALAGR